MGCTCLSAWPHESQWRWSLLWQEGNQRVQIRVERTILASKSVFERDRKGLDLIILYQLVSNELQREAYQTDISLLFDQTFDLVSLLDHIFLSLHPSDLLTQLTLPPSPRVGFRTGHITFEEWRHFNFGN